MRALRLARETTPHLHQPLTLLSLLFAGICSADLHLHPIEAPSDGRLRLAVDQVTPGQRIRIESASRLLEDGSGFVPVALGDPGQGIFDLPLAGEGELYFRAFLETPDTASSARPSINLNTGVQRVPALVPFTLAGSAEILSPVAPGVGGGTLRIAPALGSPTAGDLLRVDPSGPLHEDPAHVLTLGGAILGRVVEQGPRLEVQLAPAITTLEATAIARAIQCVPAPGNPLAPLHSWTWQLVDGGGVASLPRLQAVEVEGGCSRPVDVALVIDRTGSMSAGDVASMRGAATNFVRAFGPVEGWRQVGVISFCGSAFVHVPLTSDVSRLLEGIATVERVGRPDGLACEETFVGSGLQAATGLLSSPASERVILIMTDGQESARDRPLSLLVTQSVAIAASARAGGIRVVACGIGPEPDVAHLRDIVGAGEEVLLEPDFSRLSSLFAGLGSGLCPDPTRLVPRLTVGPDQTIWLPSEAGLSGVCDNCSADLEAGWRVVDAPGPVGIRGAGPLATARFEVPGRYGFEFAVRDGAFHASRHLNLTVLRTNAPPLVSAGPDLTVRGPFQLVGRVEDDGIGRDGLPDGRPPDILWSQISGPAQLQWDSPDRATTVARATVPGHYELELRARDASGLMTTDRMQVTVEDRDPWEQFHAVGYASAGIGGLRGFGDGTLSLTGVRGPVVRAWLYWHGPGDSAWPNANATVQFQGAWITGELIGVSHDDHWSYADRHPFASAQAYRADVTRFVAGDGNYALTGFRKMEEIEVNGASLVVVYQEPDPTRRHDLWLWSGNESNGPWAPSLNDSVHAIALMPEGAVLLGGDFTEAAGVNRRRIARLLPGGELDLGFDPGAGPDGPIEVLLPSPAGGVYIGGPFGAVGGQPRPGLARLESQGRLDPGFLPGLPEGERVSALCETDGLLWVGGSFGLAALGAEGNVLVRLPLTGDVLALAPRPGGGGVVVGGDFRLPDSPDPVRLATVDPEGRITPSPLEFDGPIRALAWGGDSGLYVGGGFTSVSGLRRHGVARLLVGGGLDESWEPGELNQLPGQEVLTLLPESPGTEGPWGNQLLLVGGHLQLSAADGSSETRLLVRLVDGSLDLETFVPFPGGAGDRVEAIAEMVDSGDLWVGGMFLREGHRNRAPLDRWGGVRAGNVGDRGWGVRLPPIPPGSPVELELHVSDGQHGNVGGGFLDPDLLWDDALLLSPGPVSVCDEEQRQLFAGTSVPGAHHECWENLGLWDIARIPVPAEWVTATPSVLRTRYSEDPGSEDFLTLVALAVLTPASDPASLADAPKVAAAVDDEFSILRAGGPLRLDVLGNDIVPLPVKLLSVEGALAGTAELTDGGSAILYTPADNPTPADVDRLRYTAQLNGGGSITGQVRIRLEGAIPIGLGDGDQVILTNLSTGPSPTRGPLHNGHVYRYHATGSALLELTLRPERFPAHLYVKDPAGEILASAAYPADPLDGEGLGETTLRLECVLLRQGDYWIEVAGDRPGDGGDYLLELIQSPLGAEPLSVTVDAVPLADGVVLGPVPSIGRTFRLRVQNLTAFPIIDVLPVALGYDPGLEHRFAPSDPVTLSAGGEVTFSWEVTPTQPGEIHESVFDLELLGSWSWAGFRDLRLEVDDRSPGLRLDASQPAPDRVDLSVIPLRGGSPAETTFFADSAQGQQVWRVSGTRMTLTNPPAGHYVIRAEADGERSQRVNLDLGLPDLLRPGPPSPEQSFTVLANSHDNVLRVLADAPPGDRLLSVSSPSLGSAVASAQGEVILYTPPLDLVGLDRLGYVAISSNGVRSLPVSVRVAIEAPALEILQPEEGTVFSVGESVDVTAALRSLSAAVARVRLLDDGEAIWEGAHPPYSASWVPARPGFHRLEAELLDETGAVHRSPPVRVGVATGGDIPPTARITSPRQNGVIREGRLVVEGVALDPDGPVDYTLQLTEPGGQVRATFKGGGRVEGGRLGELDLTLLRNGVYDLSLRCTGGVRGVHDHVRLFLQSEAKVGQFTFTETDLELPAAGLPLVVGRTYDSINPGGGDFGPGWSLLLHDLDVGIDEEREDRVDEDSGEPFSLRVGGGRDMTLTLPGGRRVTFEFRLEPGAEEGGVPCFCYQATWIAPPGVNATLTAMGNRELRYIPFQQQIDPFWVDAGPGTPMENYDFHAWVLTNEDGSVFRITRPAQGIHSLGGEGVIPSQAECFGPPRLESILLRGGERVEITRGGTETRVEHWDARDHPTRALWFHRNPAGRIDAVYDRPGAGESGVGAPAEARPPRVRYAYDQATGNLASVDRLVERDPPRYVTRHYYYTNTAVPHLLTGVRDERGVLVAAVEYDPSGRLAGLRDGSGAGTTLQHDPTGRTLLLRDPAGAVTLHEYDPRGNVLRTVEPDGGVHLWSYDELGHPVAETNHWGTAAETWTLRQFNERGDLLAVTNAHDTNLFAYDARGLLLSHHHAWGGITTNRYDVQGRLVESALVTSNGAQRMLLAYDAAGRLAATLDPLGTSHTNVYGGDGLVVAVGTIDAGGRVLSWIGMEYDDSGNLTGETSSRTLGDGTLEFSTRRQSYNLLSQPTEATNGLGFRRSLRLDPAGRKLEERDELGNTTRYFHDRRGDLIQTLRSGDAATPRSVLRQVRDSVGRPIWTQDAVYLREGENPEDSVTTAGGGFVEYDGAGRVVRAGRCRNLVIQVGTDAEGVPFSRLVEAPEILAAHLTHYDEGGRIDWTRDDSGLVTAYGYDVAGRRVAITNGFGTDYASVTRSVYGGAGLLTESIDPVGRSTLFEYDGFLRRRATWLPEVDGRREALLEVYDVVGRVIARTNELGQGTLYEYDPLGRLISVTNAPGLPEEGVTRYGYDEAGNRVIQEDALGRVTHYEYDALGHRVARWLPGGERELMSYDPSGNLLLHTNFNGRVIEHRYDALGRLTLRVERGAPESDPPLAAFTYTATGQRATQRDPSGESFYAYDDFDRLSRKEQPGWGTLEYSYLPGGLLGSTAVTAGAEAWRIDYSYDPLHRLTGATIPGYGMSVAYEYDAAGTLLTMSYGNGLTNRYNYDNRNRLTNLVWGTEGKEWASFDYRVNAAGQRTRLTERLADGGGGARTYDWEYDPLQRLVSERISDLGQAVYRYDKVGNRLERISSLPGVPSMRLRYDQNDRIDPDDDPMNRNPDYDAAGNMLRLPAAMR